MKKIKLASLPTPIRKLHHLSQDFQKNIYLKEDGLTGVEVSGNKVRKLEYIMAHVLNNHHDTIITTGAIQSNHTRATAAVCARMNLECHLVLAGDKREWEGNLFLEEMMGAHIHFISACDSKEAEMEKQAQLLKEKGKNPFIIPVGASTALGAFGYVECFEEILKQEREMGISFHNIVLPVGSGGTYAGIWYGNAVHESKKNILGISVNHRKKFFEEIICKIIQEMDPTIEDFSSLQIIDNYIGIGYAQYREQELQEYYHIAKREGVLLDPCYTGKAFLGMCREIPLLEGNTLFIHTGGVFGWTKEMREELFKMIKKENKNV